MTLFFEIRKDEKVVHIVKNIGGRIIKYFGGIPKFKDIGVKGKNVFDFNTPVVGLKDMSIVMFTMSNQQYFVDYAEENAMAELLWFYDDIVKKIVEKEEKNKI